MKSHELGKECRVSLYEVGSMESVGWIPYLYYLSPLMQLSELSNSFACFLNFLRFTFRICVLVYKVCIWWNTVLFFLKKTELVKL
jgi:hypothetical protein